MRSSVRVRGKGGHLWLFFEEAEPALLARKLGTLLLTGAMELRPDIGFGSYDRLFPNQDTLPKGGFGNLIALPLQKKARENRNSVFVDERFQVIEDQWAYLSSIRRISSRDLEIKVREAEQRGKILSIRTSSSEDEEPWKWMPSRLDASPSAGEVFPDEVEIILGDQIYISKDISPPSLLTRLLRIAAFQNPEFYKAQAMRLPVYDKPRVIHCAEDFAQHIGLPRGCLEETTALLKLLEVKVRFRDERYAGVAMPWEFEGTLRPEQQVSGQALLKHDIGVLAATTAFGKTVLGAWMIAQRRVNTLILVHRRQLLVQWVERLSQFLGIPKSEIGKLGGGKKSLTGRLDVALIQSLIRDKETDDRVADYGFVIVDECHHISARSFETVIKRAKAKYVLGLSATVTRKDGRHPIIFMQCGPIRYRVDARKQASERPFDHSVYVRPTAFVSIQTTPDPRKEFQCLVTDLTLDERRTRMICDDIEAVLRQGRRPLVLTERTEHLGRLASKLRERGLFVVELRGGLGRKASREALQEAESNTNKPVLVATGSYIGEGFDDPRLDTLFLAFPISWRGTLAQYAGRLHRLHEGKHEVRIYDYADLNVSMLGRMFDRRCKGYEAIGYTVLLPASAIPGWPPGVPLPVEPEWKETYASSIRRLIRDGVDEPVADLFLKASQKPAPDALGEQRARSAAEAFLYRRLETLSETSGLFRLNHQLQIPFDLEGNMEVDFVCEEARLVIELDGPHHFVSEDSYRRDRRKDVLLQRHGWFVLRFLSEDASRDLDTILDSLLEILRARR